MQKLRSPLSEMQYHTVIGNAKATLIMIDNNNLDGFLQF
jgi:hypothetical protein